MAFESPPEHPTQWPYWAIIVAVFGLAALSIFFQNNAFYRDYLLYFSHLPSLSRREINQPVRVTIDFGERRRAFQGEIVRGMTILSALRASGEAGGFAVVTDDRGDVMAIAGLTPNGKKWQAYLNNVRITGVPGRVDIKAGDRIVFRYE